MIHETIDSIIQWHKQTFPDATLRGQLKKFDDECLEWHQSDRADISELADMAIVACGIARFSAERALFCFSEVYDHLVLSTYKRSQLAKAIDKKMAINRQRKWKKTGGSFQHIEGDNID